MSVYSYKFEDFRYKVINFIKSKKCRKFSHWLSHKTLNEHSFLFYIIIFFMILSNNIAVLTLVSPTGLVARVSYISVELQPINTSSVNFKLNKWIIYHKMSHTVTHKIGSPRIVLNLNKGQPHPTPPLE